MDAAFVNSFVAHSAWSHQSKAGERPVAAGEKELREPIDLRKGEEEILSILGPWI